MTPTAITLLSNSLDAIWPAIDPKSRTFRQAFSAALARATAQDWPAGDAVAVADVQALAIGTQLYVEAMKDRPDDPYSDMWGAVLKRTSEILAKKVGYTGQETADTAKANASKVLGFAWGPLLELIAVLALVGVVIYFLIANGSAVVDHELARDALERELVRAHAAAEKVVGDHLAAEAKAGHTIPWSAGELAYLNALVKIQEAVIRGISTLHHETPSVWSTPWPYLGIATVGLVILGVVYREEIKEALRQPRRLAA